MYLAMERHNDHNIDKYLRKQLRRETRAKRNHGGKFSQPNCDHGKGHGGQLKNMQEIFPSNGQGVRNLFYRRPTDDVEGPCHAHDRDGRASCLLPLLRTQKMKDGGGGGKHQDHFRCTIMCGRCGKRRHYVHECHKKNRILEKHKKAEEERMKQGVNGNPARRGVTR